MLAFQPMGPRIGAFGRNLPLPFLILAFLAILSFPAQSQAAGDTVFIKPLPSKQLEQVYRNGDLDSVVLYIKMGRAKPVFLDRADSVVAFKYLGIIYSADVQTREKGRYYFNQLLLKDPKATLTELMPGENARATFKEARAEFFELYPHLAPKPDSTFPAAADGPVQDQPTVVARVSPDAQPATEPKIDKPGKKRSWTWLWVTTGVVAAGGAAAVALLDPPSKTYTLND